MDNQTLGHRSRTYWTQTMERYFIDLMLEHMQRGNKIGHTFNKQAWSDMLSVFNAKFGSEYDKDVLKSHYTNMWKQFNDIKNLLGQNGFSWDETQQMVVAENYVWEAYLKVHPDVRSYKTKTVLNFNDLCLIYGYTIADGRYSRSSHDINNDDEAKGMYLGDGIGSLAPLNIERSKTDWTTAMDQYFIELMLAQLERGNKLDSTFSKQAWTDMLILFNAKYGSQHNKRVLRHRYKKLWKYYNDVTVLLKQTGFSWDEKQQMVTADDDVWDSYIKAHPYVRSYRTKLLPNYKDLGFIFGDSINDGVQSDYHQDDDIIGAKAGCERSRTYWTPPMDRYLINLLVDQVHRGNRFGPTFIGQAWIDMVVSFNANFKSHHDKEVLKNRYKQFRKQYNDVKVLLEQTGFSWDETREMVTAEDHIWDAYIEAHPDARSYRVKTVPSYHKLYIIYGQVTSDGIYSRLARNVDPYSEIPITWKGEESHSSAEPALDWTPLMDRYFIDLMLGQIRGEFKIIGHAFDDQVWADLTISFTKKVGSNYNRDVLESRYTSLMCQCRDINNLLKQRGFTWDDTRHIVSAEDDLWEAYIKEHPHTISYKDRKLQDYEDLRLIFGSETTNEDSTSKTDHNFLDMDTFEFCDHTHIPLIETESYVETNKRVPTMTPSPMGRFSKAQKTGEEDICEAFADVANMVSELVSKKVEKSRIAIERALDALRAISDMDDEILLDGCDLLEDVRKAKTFLALDVSLRKKWLLRKLGR